MDKFNIYHLDTDPKPDIKPEDTKETRIVSLTAGEFMIYDMLSKIVEIMRSQKK